jgi:hypothetical protein
MAVKKSGSIQRRILEIGMVSKIAHNLARYNVMDNPFVTPGEFILSIRTYMMERQVPRDEINRLITSAENQARGEIDFFLRYGHFAKSDGGTAISIESLIGHVLDEIGYP